MWDKIARLLIMILCSLPLLVPSPGLGGDQAGRNPVSSVSEELSEIKGLIGRTRVGGWVDFVYKDSDQKDFNQFFDLHHFYLYFDNRLNDYWQAFLEVEYEHIPDLKKSGSSGGLKLERGYIQYTYSDYAKVRLGKFNTPLGIWTPAHWAILVDSVAKPIHDDNQYVPRKSVGIELSGNRLFPLETSLDPLLTYSLYISNGPEISGTNSVSDNQLGAGVDANVRIGDRYLIGWSGNVQHNQAPALSGKAGRREVSMMVYGEALLPYGVLVRGEYFSQNRGKGDPSLDVIYGKVKWSFREKWYLNYRWNRGEDEKEGMGGKESVNTFTLSYWPLLNVRMKGEVSTHSFENSLVEDYSAWMFWAGYIF